MKQQQHHSRTNEAMNAQMALSLMTSRGAMAENIKDHVSDALDDQLAKRVPELPADHIKAVWPAIVNEAFPDTMQNYRIWVAAYNERIKVENEPIQWHNAGVDLHIEYEGLTELQKAYADFFPKRYSHLNDREYNAEVDKVCEQQQCWFIKKRYIQTIKPATELFFMNMLHLYNADLMKRYERRQTFKITDVEPLPPIEINANFVRNLEREGVKSLPVCAKTVRNHRQRLEEAGIFVNYIFRGHKHGVMCHINPKILVVFDIFTDRPAPFGNQSLTAETGKMLPDNDEPTRPLLEEYKKKDEAAPSSDDKVSAEPTAFVYKTGFYETTSGKVGKFTEGAAAENVKVELTPSEKLRSTIIHPQALAVKLAKFEFVDYIPIDIRDVEHESMYGKLVKSEFKEVLVQEICKRASKIYRLHTPYAGSWKQAINELTEKLFYIPYLRQDGNKQFMFQEFRKITWMLQYAHKWFNANSNVKPLNPGQYFDFSRKSKKEMGFWYLEGAWRNHLKNQEKDPVKQQAKQRAIEKRKQIVNYAQLYEGAITQFIKGRKGKDIHWLCDYIQNNLPPDWYAKLPGTLERLKITVTP